MQAWEKFLTLQEAELGAETIRKWLRPLKVVKFDACNLYLQAKDSFQILWFEEHMRSKTQNLLFNNNNKKIKVHLFLENFSELKKEGISPSETEQSKELLPLNLSFDTLDPHSTFKSLISFESNPLPYKYLEMLSGWDAQSQTLISGNMGPVDFNPVYLAGSSGSGKTHMLMATADAFKKQGLKTIYVRAETFTEHVVGAIRGGEMAVFRESYRNCDALLIDDVHIFGRKWATQEELFHTFNTLHLAGKQIILSANCLPSELQFIEPRLISRFEWGIVLPLETPSQEQMQHVLKAKIKELNFPVNTKVEEFLLETFSRNCKALTKALEALILRVHLSPARYQPKSTDLNVPFVKNALADLIIEEEKSAITPDRIVQQVAEHFGIRSDDILGKSQNRECALPRQLSMFFCRNNLKMPYTKIGDLFGRDHSTVMSSVKIIQKALADTSSDVSSSCHAIQKKLF